MEHQLTRLMAVGSVHFSWVDIINGTLLGSAVDYLLCVLLNDNYLAMLTGLIWTQ